MHLSEKCFAATIAFEVVVATTNYLQFIRRQVPNSSFECSTAISFNNSMFDCSCFEMEVVGQGYHIVY